MQLDLNSDLGEGEPRARTEALMRSITSANIACGGHAGNTASMLRCVRLARQYGVRIGAHPGLWDRKAFGRSGGPLTPAELELLLLHQISALEKIIRAEGAKLHHIKLHGSLYHQTERAPELARAYVRTVKRYWPNAGIYALAGGLVVRTARANRLRAFDEVFLDRAYRDDGSLLPRNEPGALLTSPSQIQQRLRLLSTARQIETVSGKLIRVPAQTLCIHSDTPGSPRLAQLARRALNTFQRVQS
ncbi:MAG: LamB/YcsF family protein [Verrucomicrobia subdivision 3 bacterium]|nr:LamB/YcsF family protein [Limisphaerales bacterium]